ncbi:hypothetical protein Pdw03_3602 [Penicillium digitatum]|uniref:Uncharacterized protein n=1 Tax=Penicillium digitatum TaxID=36651 RepID=A0A7T6XGI7_PENDI|nr:hypothetical protein Pdw03_3602 [Penicillium digitatum]
MIASVFKIDPRLAQVYPSTDPWMPGQSSPPTSSILCQKSSGITARHCASNLPTFHTHVRRPHFSVSEIYLYLHLALTTWFN